MKLLLRRTLTTLAILAVLTTITLVVVYARHEHHVHHERYRHALEHTCDSHRGVKTFVAPGTTGVYIVCRDGFGTKIER